MVESTRSKNFEEDGEGPSESQVKTVVMCLRNGLIVGFLKRGDVEIGEICKYGLVGKLAECRFNF